MGDMTIAKIRQDVALPLAIPQEHQESLPSSSSSDVRAPIADEQAFCDACSWQPFEGTYVLLVNNLQVHDKNVWLREGIHLAQDREQTYSKKSFNNAKRLTREEMLGMGWGDNEEAALY